MTTEIKPANLLELNKRPESFDLTISEGLEKKIRYLLNRFPNTEYSGTVFYTVEGSFKDKNLKINAIDFFLQDIGSATYTMFEQSPDLVAYMCDNPELLNEGVYQGLMHSHHTMGAFFSGTDYATLKEEGNERSHFLSLIVDTKGTYEACITRKVAKKATVSGISESYTFNGEKVVEKYNRAIDNTVLEYYVLKIHRPATCNPELDCRIEELLKKKNEVKVSCDYTGPLWNNAYYPQKNISKTVMQGEKEKSYAIDVTNIKADDSVIQWLTAQLIAGDITYSENANLEELYKTMNKRFDNRFSCMEFFKAWASSIVEYIVYYNEPEEILASNKDLDKVDDDALASLTAQKIIEKLQDIESAKDNEYINCYINLLNNYI